MGMLGVTIFGLIFTPVFYTVVRRLFSGPLAANQHPVTTEEVSPQAQHQPGE